MNSTIETAARSLAESISRCMDELRAAIAAAAPGAHVYAVVLAVLDDFSDVQAYANTDAHLAEREGPPTDKWYFGEFWSEGMGVEFDALEEQLGPVEDWDEDPENSNAPQWLAAMTHAMGIARQNGAFKFDNREAVIFCSMVDSLNAIWLEILSARRLNDAGVYDSVAPEIRAASRDWYQSDGDDASSGFRAAYESLLAQLPGAAP